MHQELPIIFWLVLSVHVYSTRRWMHGRYRTCTLTPWSRALLEKLTGSQLVNKFPAFYGTRRFITAFTNARHLSLSWAKSIQSTPPHPTSWRSILILSSHLHLGLPTGLFPSGFPTKTLYTPLISPIRAACPDHLILLNWSRKQYWVRSTDHYAPHYVVFSTPPVTSSLLCPNVLLSTLFSNTLSIRSSLNVSDKVSHPYKTPYPYTCDKLFAIHSSFLHY